MVNDEKAKILIVDDQPVNIEIAASALSEEYDVRVTNSGLKALKILEKETFDLILLDVVMPEMDGFEVCQKLKSDDATKHIPIIFLTSKHDTADETLGFKFGAADYVAKPIIPDILMARVHTHVLLKKSGDLLIEKAKKLANMNAQKDLFLGIVAHDLRNPLNVIQGYCDFLLTDSPDINEAIDVVSSIKQATMQMYHLVIDLLDVSQVNLGKFTLNKEKTELANYVYEIVKPNQLIANRKKITLNLLPIKENEFGFFDRNRIQQVIINLLTNAIKFSSPQTTITISAENIEIDGIVYSRFKVVDQGKGIKKEEIPNVFGEFQKTSTTATAGEQSTGLGLAICRSIVLAHKGEITCESVLNKGSCFSFIIPVTCNSNHHRIDK